MAADFAVKTRRIMLAGGKLAGQILGPDSFMNRSSLFSARRFLSIIAPLVLASFGISPVGSVLAIGAGGEPKESAKPDKKFIFMWGRTYERILQDIPADRIVARKPGKWLQFKQGDLVCRYSFYQRQRIKTVRVRPSANAGAGRGRTFAAREATRKPAPPLVEYEPAEDAGQARLFAVSIYYGPLALDGAYRNEVEEVLTSTYGRIMNRTRSHYDLENGVTFVRAYLEHYRQRGYLSRLVFSSRELSREMNMARRRLETAATERLREEIASGRTAPALPEVPAAEARDEEESMGYMQPAGDIKNGAATLEEEFPPALPAEENARMDPGSAGTSPNSSDLEVESETTPPESPAGLASEELPEDFQGAGDTENPFDLP